MSRGGPPRESHDSMIFTCSYMLTTKSIVGLESDLAMSAMECSKHAVSCNAIFAAFVR